MKKFLAVVVALFAILSLAACGGKTDADYEIPDVFGINYAEAIAILEADGFEVRAVETGVDSFSVKLLYPLERVDKGTVFKIDEYIIDNNGNLNKNYDVFYDGGLVSRDKSVVIYYAKEDYVLSKDETPTVEPPSAGSDATPDESIPVETNPTESVPTEAPPTESDTNDGLRPEFKEAMDSYEAFMDEYVAFMKKYLENPTDAKLLADYAKFMTKYMQFVEDFDQWENTEMNAAETAYYIEVQNRVAKKLLEIAY